MASDTNFRDEKLKPLNPSLRQKKRFLRVKITSEKKFSFQELSRPLTEAIIQQVGLIDFSTEGIWLIKEKFDEENQVVIIKVSTKLKDKLSGALLLISKIGNNEVSLEVEKVGSTLKAVC